MTVDSPYFLNLLKDKILSAGHSIDVKQANELLQKAILCGEYHLSKNRDVIDIIERALDDKEFGEEVKLIEQNKSEEKDNSIRYIKQRLFTPFKELSNNVTENLRNFHEHKEGNTKDIKIFQEFDLKNELAELFKLTDSVKQNLPIELTYQANIMLAYIDEYLECNNEILRGLKNVKSYLELLTLDLTYGEVFPRNKEILKILIDKVNFLIFKINYRKFLSEKNTYADFDKEIPHNSVYKVFYKRISLHYENAGQKIVSIQNSINQNPHFILEPYHHLNRCINKEIGITGHSYCKSQIEILIRKLNEKIDLPEYKDTFNQVALQSLQNLLNNTSFKLELKLQESKEFNDILQNFLPLLTNAKTVENESFLGDFQTKMKNFSTDSPIHDYYCFKSFVEFLNKAIIYLKKNPEKLIPQQDQYNESNLKAGVNEIINRITNYYRNSLVDLDSTFRKMLTHQVKPVYMLYSECSVQYSWENDEDKGELFLHSSYILPNNFLKIEKEIESWEREIDSRLLNLKDALHNHIGSLIVEHNIKEHKKAIEETKEETKKEFDKRVKDNEFKTVSIIAMFVSVASFVLGSLKIFENRTGLESIGILFGLSACLFIFNLFFYFVILDQNKANEEKWNIIKKKKWFLTTPILFGIISIVILLFAGKRTQDSINDLNKKYDKDSTERISLKHMYDSLNAVKDSIERDKIIKGEVNKILDSLGKKH